MNAEGDVVEVDRAFENQKIQVLLTEYSTVKSTTVARTTASLQGIAILVATLGVAATQLTDHPRTTAMLLAVVVPFLAIVGLIVYLDLNNEAAHLRRLEAEINRRTGETLMTYETRHSSLVKGIWARLRGKRSWLNPS